MFFFFTMPRFYAQTSSVRLLSQQGITSEIKYWNLYSAVFVYRSVYDINEATKHRTTWFLNETVRGCRALSTEVKKWRRFSNALLVLTLNKTAQSFQINIFQLKSLNITNSHIIIFSTLPKMTETQRQFHNYMFLNINNYFYFQNHIRIFWRSFKTLK